MCCSVWSATAHMDSLTVRTKTSGVQYTGDRCSAERNATLNKSDVGKSRMHGGYGRRKLGCHCILLGILGISRLHIALSLWLYISGKAFGNVLWINAVKEAMRRTQRERCMKEPERRMKPLDAWTRWVVWILTIFVLSFVSAGFPSGKKVLKRGRDKRKDMCRDR